MVKKDIALDIEKLLIKKGISNYNNLAGSYFDFRISRTYFKFGFIYNW